MRPANTEWQRQRNVNNRDELDTIVAEVFQSLEESAPVGKGAVNGRRGRRREGSAQSETREASKPSDDGKPVMAPEAQLDNDDPLTSEQASPLPSNAAMDATPLHALPSNDADSISAEEQSFVEGALAFLLERPNGELLLERIGSSFLEGWHGGAGADRIRTTPEKIDGRSPPSTRRKGA